MNTSELSTSTDSPIQSAGAAFYFAPTTAAYAETIGVNAFNFYGLGRGGVLGNVDSKKVYEEFYFFSQGSIDFLYGSGLDKAEAAATAKHYVQAAYAFADATFGAIATDVLAKFASAAQKVNKNVAAGQYSIYDGYMQYETPSNPVHAAYVGVIQMRELRGGVHTVEVKNAGLSPIDACYIQDAGVFKLHGYTDEDIPVVTDELKALKKKADENTQAKFASYLEVLSDEEKQNFLDGANAMFAALSNPQAI